jgi:WD40 repeat protein
VNSAPTSPYKGLSAFEDSELDALLFFGREREREIVVANLIASRLTVLYGPSGVGKSSLLRASVARSLRELPEKPLVVVFSRWSEDPEAALAEAVAAFGGGRNGSAVAALEHAQEERDVYLVLDQAEEYFLYHGDESGPGTFAEALPTILAAPYRVNVLVSMREDSLAKLDRFTGRIPGLFANTLRLDRLDRASAEAAIVRPVERYNALTASSVVVEAGLVARVLEEVGTGRIEPATGGRGAVEDADGSRIEAPYLQLVMQRLWEEERAAGSGTLRLTTLQRLGGAKQIVEEHLEGAMSVLDPRQKDVASKLFNHLVTPSGSKISHELPDLVDFAGVRPDELRPVLETLTDRRILRSLQEGGSVRYEIFHDVLAQPVLAWRTQHEADRELEREREAADRRHRRLLAVIGIGSVLLAVMTAVTVYALLQRGQARGQTREARAHELEAVSSSRLDSDPELSLVLASEAARLAASDSAEETLRNALLSSRVRAVYDFGEPLLGAAKRGERIFGATADGELVEVAVGSGQRLRVLSSGAPATHMSFADDGTALFTGRDGSVRVVRPGRRSSSIPGVDDAKNAEISADGSVAVILTDEGARLVNVSNGEVRQIFAHRGAMSAALSRGGTRLVTGAADDTVRAWITPTGRLVRPLPDNQGHPTALAFTPASAYVAAASTDGLGRIWRFGRGGVAATLTGDATALTDIDFSTDGAHVVTASNDGTVRISNAETGAPLVTLTGHTGKVTSATFTGPAGSPVLTASSDGTARVWDALYQPVLAELSRLRGPVTRIHADAVDGIQATVDGRAYVVDPETGKVLRTERGAGPTRRFEGPDGTSATIRGNTVVLTRDGKTTVLKGHRNRVFAVAFSPDGSLMATASKDHDARIWDVETGETIEMLQHNSEVRDVEFSPDGRWVVTSAGRAVLWDARTGALVVRLQGHEGPVTAAGFDRSGRVVTGGVDGTVRVYTCNVCGGLDELVELADRRLAKTGRELTPDERERYLG